MERRLAVRFGMTRMSQNSLDIHYIQHDFSVGDLDSELWERGASERLTTHWDDTHTPEHRHVTFVALWSDEHFYIRFETADLEPAVIADEPNLQGKTIGLWDRDVCEIFIAPDKNEPRRYFEFEVAPTGEWLDVAIDLTGGQRVSDWEYASGMQTAAQIEADQIVMAIKIPFTAFGKTPQRGDVWLGNIFRCVGTDPNRGYLAWSPTFTEVPAFHVPERFAELHFV